MLDICEKFAKYYDVVVNSEKKTKCMYFANKRVRKTLGSVTLCGSILQIVNTEKYLGHYISSDLSDTSDIRNQIKGFYVCANMILPKFSRCSEDVKINLVRAYCCNVYCCSLWYSFYMTTRV